MDFNAAMEMQSKAQRFEKAKYEARNAAPFPYMSSIAVSWLRTALHLMHYTSPVAAGLSPVDFIGFAKIEEEAEHKCSEESTKPQLSMFQVGALCNNVESQNAHTIGMGLSGFASLLEETSRVAVLWNRADADLMVKVKKDFDADEDMRRKQAERQNKDPMKVIKAEA